MAFIKVTKREKQCMRSKGGYREKTIMNNAGCYTSWNGSSRYVKVHNRQKNGGSLDSAVYDRKTCRWIN